ncbi:MAG TPA: ORF6N domain-containing protein [Vicinamibacterales bacterium]|nr:ORF6N domain-containing protein [Vicinamibacterales bacterium]
MATKPARADGIADAIQSLRGQKVLLDATLAALYGVQTKALNQAVRRNRARFPSDFMFQLTVTEATNLRSQSVTSTHRRHGGRRHRPYAFTEQGVAMLSTVLKSPRAIAVNIEIMRAFVHLRAMLVAHSELSARIDALERQYDSQFRSVFQAIRQLMEPAATPQRRIGFRRHE